MKTPNHNLELTEKRVLIFEGIDDWNRPVFKDNLNNRFGNTEILFDWDATEEDVLAVITEEHIQYFGGSFNCEPIGTPVKPDRILIQKKKP